MSLRYAVPKRIIFLIQFIYLYVCAVFPTLECFSGSFYFFIELSTFWPMSCDYEPYSFKIQFSYMIIETRSDITILLKIAIYFI
jgi:hypothetical protein